MEGPGTLIRDPRLRATHRILLFLKKIMRKRQMTLGFRMVLFNKPSKHQSIPIFNLQFFDSINAGMLHFRHVSRFVFRFCDVILCFSNQKIKILKAHFQVLESFGNWKSFKNDEKCFLFNFKSLFCFQVI